LWRELPSLRDPIAFRAWSTRILVNECNAEARQRTRMTGTLRALPTDAAFAQDDVLGVVNRDELERGFRRLPADQRAVLVLHHYVGLEPTEIAETLGIPAGTVRSRLHYAHRAMRAVLEADARATTVSAGGDR
jgi:RNA polymerase sigma-70 factor (ECF subfamily)